MQVKRQRDVVREQHQSITTLMQHVEDLQTDLTAKDAQIKLLRDQLPPPPRSSMSFQADPASPTAHSTPQSHSTSKPDPETIRQLERQKQTVKALQARCCPY
jgi:hypothetical protein